METRSCVLSSIQRVNHHPAPVGKQADIIKKDGLLRAVRRMCATYPKCTKLLLLPMTFHLPREEHQFVSTFCQNTRNSRNKVSKPHAFKSYEHSECLADGCGNYTNRTIGETKTDTNIWILKPADLSRGRGIYLFNQLEDLIYLSKSVVQKYITDPLLIEGYKFDLRLYAVVPSYAPFIVYICADGLVRFATERYDLDDLKNVYSHLTNSSININGPGYLINKAGIGRGCKWTIRQLRQWLTTRKMDDRLLWTRVKVLIILTLLSQAGSTPKVPNAYELFGFDILVDSHLRPWLIEVNANPSLSNDCIVDELVKKPLIKSIVEMLRLDQPTLICSGKHTACFTHLTGSTQLQLKSTPVTRPVGDHQPFQHSTSNKHSEIDNKQATLDDVSASELTLTQPTSNNHRHGSLRMQPVDIDSLTVPTVNQAGRINKNFTPDTSYSSHTYTRKEYFNSLGTTQLPFKWHSSTLNRFQSVLSSHPRLADAHTFEEPCPLYGPGVELLLPQLCALGRRFANLLEPSGKRFQRDNISSSTQSWHTDCTKSASVTYPSAYFHVTSQRELVPEEYKAGNQLIPHNFGQLKLAFPFNLITRIACAREPGGYPDQNTIVRQVNQLVQHCAQNVKDNCLHKDFAVIDIPEVWSDKTTNWVET
ncbi:hypothetical protein EG68_07545 [Paragonimus skrjabini miyazakii]|uniref:Tubulin polyglutamylase TTLL2 n=1 Tax=Paragonimus skrjabini miyazakii TaxID=59628 RepID=A0A8S9YEX7_9TREM|nr:hypothetical protein EG68_07545 [Paragonimus skrjabini miyazakii]